jgi:hypothetical protein
MTKTMRCVARRSRGSCRCHLLVLSVVFCLLPLLAHANSDYYRRVIFDNSLTSDDYFYSTGQASGQSFLEQRDNRLPVETKIFLTPPNAIRLQWQSAPGGGWVAQIQTTGLRNRLPGLSGHNLYFWIFAPQPIGAADLPKVVLSNAREGLQVAEFPGSFSDLLISGNTRATCHQVAGYKFASHSPTVVQHRSIPSNPNTYRTSPSIRVAPMACVIR